MEHDALVCSRCGNLVSECSDPAIDWHPHRSICFATASAQWGRRVLDRLHSKAAYEDDALHPLEGVSVYVARTEPVGDQRLDGAQDEGSPA